MFKKVKNLLLATFTNLDGEYDREGYKVYKRTIKWRCVLIALACLWLAFAVTSFTVWCIIHLPLKTLLGCGALFLTILSVAIVFVAATGDL